MHIVRHSRIGRLLACMLLLLGLGIAPSIASATLVGHWKLDEVSGSTTATDSTGTWPVGTLSGGPPFVLGKVGNALSFDGVNDIVLATDPLTLDLTGPLTLSVWVDLNGDPGSTRGHVAGQNTYGGGTADIYYLEYHKGTNTFNFTIANAAGIRIQLDSIATFTNTAGFVHLAGVFDPGVSMKLYIDGVLNAMLADATVPAAANNVHPPFSIGRLNSDLGNNTFNGLIDDVQLYDEAHSASSIGFLFNNPGVAIPEPSTVLLLACGLAAMAVGRGRRGPSRP